MIVAQQAMGTGRLEGPICTREHSWVNPTPGRADGGWENVEAGCWHLASNWAAFPTIEAAEATVEADAIH